MNLVLLFKFIKNKISTLPPPRFAQELRANLQDHVGKLGFIDETDGKGKDQWCDLYLADTPADCWRRCPAFKLDYIA